MLTSLLSADSKDVRHVSNFCPGCQEGIVLNRFGVNYHPRIGELLPQRHGPRLAKPMKLVRGRDLRPKGLLRPERGNQRVGAGGSGISKAGARRVRSSQFPSATAGPPGKPA